MKTERDLPSQQDAAPPVGGPVSFVEAETTGAVPETGFTDVVARSQWQLIRRRFFRHKLAVAALVVLMLLALAAILAPWIAPHPLNPQPLPLLEANQGPSGSHWFGTDELGRDQLTRVMFAMRVSLAIGFFVALAAAFTGTIVGSLAGFFGGRVDQLLMRFTDLMLIIPPLAILLIAGKELGNSVRVFAFVLVALFWMTVARIVRGVYLSLKEKEFVDAARASGASSGRIIARHMLPNAIGPILVNTTLVVGLAIIAESTLSYLGFGVRPPDVSLGTMLQQSNGAVGTDRAYLIYFPAMVLTLIVLAVNYLGDGLRDALDPQSSR